VLEKYFRLDGIQQDERTTEHKFNAEVKSWLFPQVLQITKHWFSECVVCKDNTFPQMLLLFELAHDVADRIYQAITGRNQAVRFSSQYFVLTTRLVSPATLTSTHHEIPTKPALINAIYPM